MEKNNERKRGDVRTEMTEMEALAATEMTGAIPALLTLEQQQAVFTDLFKGAEDKAETEKKQ